MISDWRNRITNADVIDGLRQIPDGVVQVCVTSPPYWGLRSYLPADHPDKALEIGSEATAPEYVEKMVGVFGEVRRVMRDDGVLWLNIGDSYCQDSKWGGWSGNKNEAKQGYARPMARRRTGLKDKDLYGIPWTLALALRDDGWYLRSDVIWAKKSPMPESLSGWRWERCRVKVRGTGDKRDRLKGSGDDRPHITNHSGNVWETATWQACPGCPKCEKHNGYILRKGSWRCTSSHEHLFMLAKSACYFGDREAVAEANATAGRRHEGRSGGRDGYPTKRGFDHRELNPSGRNKRDVWTLSNQPRPDLHFAAFPDSLVEPCILSSTSAKGACPECGMPWARVIGSSVTKVRPPEGGAQAAAARQHQVQTGGNNVGANSLRDGFREMETTTKGWWASCDCNAGDPVPCVVLDPFMGRGTVAIVAKRLGRDFTGCELNPAYAQMIESNLKAECPLLMEAQP